MDRLKMWHFIYGYGFIFICFNIYLFLVFYLVNNPSSSGDALSGLKDNQQIYTALIDQLKNNQSGYANNVWQTLATLLAAIGMVLGSDKFKEMVSAKPAYIPFVQSAVLTLYVLHAIAYGMYAHANKALFVHLEAVVGQSSEYYVGYQISGNQAALNLLFDTALFLLLVYILNHLRHKVKAQ